LDGGAGAQPIPAKPSLASCRPNPFHSHAQISYALPTAGNVSLQVYDVTGRTVRTLASGFRRAGSYSVSWDAKDSRGRLVPHGVYFYRLDTPGFRDVKKAAVTRWAASRQNTVDRIQGRGGRKPAPASCAQHGRWLESESLYDGG
jgi:hypothetical protein